MTLHTHAEKELRAAGFYGKDSDYAGMIPEAVLELIDVFAKQGHSGASASIVIKLFNKLASYGILNPIEKNDPSEFTEGHIGSQPFYQGKRITALFKDGENGKPYYIDAIVWKGEEDYDTFTGMVDGEVSRQYVRFPFTPKTFYVDVVKEYTEGVPVDTKAFYVEDHVDGEKRYYQYKIKDRKQLDEVFTYYERFDPSELRK